MSSSKDLANLFFRDLKQFNSTNFRTLKESKLDENSPTIFKSFSSVVTRYFIFCERHPEVSTTDRRILYFKLKIDMIARYFSEYPDTNLDLLKAFQLELCNFVKESGGDASE